jgi:hypothetical protein
VPQQIGVPPMQTQHMQPDSMQVIMHSQHAWIIAAHALSPDTQVKQHPSLVISQVHRPQHMLHEHMVMPFIMQ